MTRLTTFKLAAAAVAICTYGVQTNMVLSAQPTPSKIVDLGTLGGTRSAGYDVNNRGQAVGVSDTVQGDPHAFLWNDGTMIDLGTFGGRSSAAYRLDDSGTAVGRAENEVGTFRAFLARFGGSLVDITPDTAEDRMPYATAYSINPLGHVVGYAHRPGAHKSSLNRKFKWNGAASEELSNFGGETGLVTAINELGQIAGSYSLDPHVDYSDRRAFMITGETMVELGTLGGRVSLPMDINDSGDVVGKSQSGTGEFHGFIYSGGSMTDIGLLADGRQSFAYGINNRGDVVGSADSGGTLRAVLYQKGVLIDLNALLPAGSGWFLNEARAISENGQIVGTGVINGQERAFLLTR